MRVELGHKELHWIDADAITFETAGELCDMCYQMKEHCDMLADSPEVDAIGRENMKHAKALLVLLGDMFIRVLEGSRELDDLHEQD